MQSTSGRPWFLLVLAVAVLAGTTLTIRALHAGAHAAARERAEDQALAIQASRLDDLEWRAIGNGSVSTKLGIEIDRTRMAMRRGVLDSYDDANVADRFSLYDRALGKEVAFLRAGRRDEAWAVDRAQVDPAFNRLAVALGANTEKNNRAAQSLGARANVLSALVLFAGLLVAGLLSWRFNRLQRSLVTSRAALAAGRDSEERFRSLIQNASDVITVTRRDMTVLFQTDSVEQVLGYHPAQLAGWQVASVIHPDDVSQLAAALDGDPAGRSFEARVRRADGSWVHLETIVSTIREDDEELVVLTSRDISERKALEERLRHEVSHDSLTGLGNASAFESRVARAIAAGSATARGLAVLLIDLDDFKTVNDTRGIGVGDAVLKVVARRIEEATPSSASCARIGGDEFAVLLHCSTGPQTAVAVAEAVLESLGSPYDAEGRRVNLTASTGIAIGDESVRTAAEFLRKADLAKDTVKAAGKGRYVVFDASLHVKTFRRLELVRELEQAIEQDQFEVHYQPLVDLVTDEVYGVEALVRWRHPKHGLLPPSEFLAAAEDSGLIVPIGRKVFAAACSQVASWQVGLGFGPKLTLWVNLSARQLRDRNLVHDLQHSLADAGLPAECLVLEITEHLFVEESEATTRRMEDLRALGLRLAVDDFGSGFSALAYLRRFLVDFLKIDRSFVAALGEGQHATRLLRGIVDLGTRLDLEVVAEGIETPKELALLQGMRARLGQGFYFDRPRAAVDLADLLASYPRRAAGTKLELVPAVGATSR